jgi:hypothetical protein
MIDRRHRIVIIAAALIGLLGACRSDAEPATPATQSTEVAPLESTESTEPAATTAATSVATTDDSTAARGIPDVLVDRWVGPPRAVGNLGTGTAAAFVDISDGLVVYETGIAENPKAFTSDVVATGDEDTFEMTLVGDILDCLDGDVGSYRWSLSPQATTLTLTADQDACAARQAAIEGQWTHTACKLEGRDCLGIVEAGTYSTNRWNPYGEFTYGQATFTLPDGWAVTYDSQAALFLGSADDYEKSVDGDPEPAWGLRSWADVAAAAPDSDDCSRGPTDQPDPTVGTGAADIAAWMVALPTLNATRSTMTIGGLQAEVVDAEIAEGASVCDWGVILIVSRTSKPDPFNYGISPGQHMRFILIDVLPGRTVSIALDDSGHPGFDALADVAMPIVESFVFSPTWPTP